MRNPTQTVFEDPRGGVKAIKSPKRKAGKDGKNPESLLNPLAVARAISRSVYRLVELGEEIRDLMHLLIAATAGPAAIGIGDPQRIQVGTTATEIYKNITDSIVLVIIHTISGSSGDKLQVGPSREVTISDSSDQQGGRLFYLLKPNNRLWGVMDVVGSVEITVVNIRELGVR